MVKVGIIGATGYGGGELYRLLAQHPQARVVAVSSRSYAGQRLGAAWPHLQGTLMYDEPEQVVATSEVVFLCLPEAVSMTLVPGILAAGKRVIDFAGDFRLPPEVYNKWYGHPHQSPQLFPQVVYGLPELWREQIKNAKLVANPGCYPTATTLALAPLAAHGLLGDDVIVNAVSGVSGAGRSAGLGTHFSEVNENFKAYKAGGVHKHLPEIERNLLRLSQGELARGRGKEGKPGAPPPAITFVPHLAPMTRGILATCYLRRDPVLSEADYQALYRDFYGGEQFISLVDEPPQTKAVWGSNRCQIHIKLDKHSGRLLVMSAIDNLGKGMASQAVQNLNILYGWPEEMAVSSFGIFP
ncbi:MAG: N-acetyl-gamma-glutamyl-phosphate reductase [Deinococcus sp.]|nr:N-acetyl-gamma-glutamyl-phosphate reductase [Deinococcus sp.]